MGPSQLLVSFLGLALSQMGISASAAHPSPLAVNAQVPPLNYQSAFDRYRPLTEEKLKPWQQSNEVARQLGGWSAFAGGKTPDIEAPEPGGETRTKPVAPAKPISEAGHSGHGRQ